MEAQTNGIHFQDRSSTRKPRKYHEDSYAMSRLPQKASDKTNKISKVEYDNLTYCIVGQISKPSTSSMEDENKVGPLPSTKELMEAQADDVLCQNLN